MDDYYVYGLKNPIDQSIFYIGKGKGKRMFSHVSENLSFKSNTDKVKILQDTQQAGAKKYLL